MSSKCVFMNITGVMVQYYIACKRELWFFANQINMNYNNDDISIGRHIHEKSFSRKRRILIWVILLLISLRLVIKMLFLK